MIRLTATCDGRAGIGDPEGLLAFVPEERDPVPATISYPEVLFPTIPTSSFFKHLRSHFNGTRLAVNGCMARGATVRAFP